LRWVRIYLFVTAVLQLAEIVGGLILRASFAKHWVIKPTQLEELELSVGLFFAGAFVVISLVWVAYFEKSERARKAFIN
jgi:predicted outer membrane lipoprotein